jgi:HPt (histidine-containing phosphotransfer) domain-containing protein
MNHLSKPKNFIFNEKLDSEYLYSLYADDFMYVEEIFGTTLQHFDQDFESMKIAYESGNVTDLKRATHKIKPTFGFVGLPQVQQVCKEFEEQCERVSDVEEVKDDYKQIVVTLADSKELLESEYRKLKEFNADSL